MAKFDAEKYRINSEPQSSGKFDVEKYRVKSKPEGREGTAALEGLGEGISLGYLNNIQAATEKPVFAILNKLTGQDVEADDYITARDSYNKRQEQLQKENPKSFMAGQLAGTMLSSAPVAGAGTAATVGGRALQGAAAGAGYGLLQNTQETEGELGGLDTKERLLNAGMGALAGAGGSLAADGITAGVGLGKKVFSKSVNAVGEKLKRTAEQLAENATGATRVQAEKYSDDAGRYLLDEGIVKFGNNAEDIANNANTAIKASEDALEKSLKTLDAQGVSVAIDDVQARINSQISQLKKDPANAPVIKKLENILNDIDSARIYSDKATPAGEEILLSTAEKTKRGFNKVAKNWQDPEQGQAGKIAYRAYRDAVEDAAQAADPALAGQFKEAKNTFGKLSPIADAAEKRTKQLNQNPIGGLLDVASVTTGAVSSDDPLTGGLAGLTAAYGRRKLAPRLSASAAVTFDKIAKQLMSNPQIAAQAAKAPEAFRAMVYSFVKPEINSGPMVLPRVAEKQGEETASLRGPDKWAHDGAQNLISAGVDQSEINALMATEKGRSLLYEAQDAKSADSPRMKSLLRRIRMGQSTDLESEI